VNNKQDAHIAVALFVFTCMKNKSSYRFVGRQLLKRLFVKQLFKVLLFGSEMRC